VLNAAVAIYTMGPLLLGALAAFGMTFLLAKGDLQARSKSALKLRNPFSLRETLALAAMLAAVKFITGAATEYFGSAGALLAALVGGLADTDSITYSMAELGRGALEPALAALGVLLAVVSNTAFKLGSGFALGGRAFALRLAAGLGIPMLAGAAIALFLSVWHGN
ncbi:MAG: DUF4010 domain-containing protein, partial [Xanthobacteraceae bacterium]